MKQELVVSQKIEDYLLRLVGREVISWDKFVFLINKIILVLMFLLLFKRGDFLTVSKNIDIYLFFLYSCLLACLLYL
jgi:hypothetical protein